MRTLLALMVLAVCSLGCSPSGSDPDQTKGIQWGGKNEAANEASYAGIRHFVNIENDEALALFELAVELDSSLFAPHTMLALMKRGEQSDYHKEMAKKFVGDKNEVSKMFVSMLDLAPDSTAAQARRDTWAKMHEAAPDGLFIHYMYARTRAVREDKGAARLAALDELIASAEQRKSNVMLAAAYNMKGYTLQQQGDLAGGTAAIEKYMELNPNGYNPLDSRAEFYLFAGDTAKAIALYKKVLDRHPSSISATLALRELEEGHDDDD